MPFLKINNFTVPIKIGGQVSYDAVQAMSRTHGGSIRVARRGTPRAWSFNTAPMVEEEATHLENMLRGLGFYWEFEGSLYSDAKGLGPDAGYSASASVNTSYPGKRGRLYVPSGTSITWDTGLSPTSWVVSGYFYDYSTASWCHIALASDGTEYYDGVSSGSPYGVSNVFSVSNGAVTVTGERLDGTNNTVLLTGLTFQPWAVPASAIAALSNMDADLNRAGGQAPFVLASGDGVYDLDDTPVDVVGTEVKSTFVGGFNSGTWENARRTVSFKLVERLPSGYGV